MKIWAAKVTPQMGLLWPLMTFSWIKMPLMVIFEFYLSISLFQTKSYPKSPITNIILRNSTYNSWFLIVHRIAHFRPDNFEVMLTIFCKFPN